MPKVHFLPLDVIVEVEPPAPPYSMPRINHNIQLDHNCGGNCACSTCHVIIESGIETLNEASEDEIDMLDEVETLQPTSRLACQCLVTSDLTVRIPPKESTWEDDTIQAAPVVTGSKRNDILHSPGLDEGRGFSFELDCCSALLARRGINRFYVNQSTMALRICENNSKAIMPINTGFRNDKLKVLMSVC